MLLKFFLFGGLYLATAVVPLMAQAKEVPYSGFFGTWYGSFNVKTTDGKSMRDNAVFVLRGDCRTMTGSAGSSIDQQRPISNVQLIGDEICFHMEPMGGLDFKLKRSASHLVGTASGRIQAVIDVTPAPGLLPHDRLLHEIENSDRKLFEAFNACNIGAYASYLSTDLEFYHDQGGKTGYQDQLDSLRQRCGEGLVLRRELVQDSLVVNAAPGFGAIEAGTHRFYAKQKDGTERVDATAKFTEIWTKATGSWKLVRVISYDHQ